MKYGVYKWVGGRERKWVLLVTVASLAEAERIAILNCRGKEDLYTEPSGEIERGYFSKLSTDQWETRIQQEASS